MNRRASSIFLVFLTAIAIIMAGFILINPLKDLATTVRGSTGLSCSDLTISDGAKSICLGIDLIIPILIITITLIAGGIIINRIT